MSMFSDLLLVSDLNVACFVSDLQLRFVYDIDKPLAV